MESETTGSKPLPPIHGARFSVKKDRQLGIAISETATYHVDITQQDVESSTKGLPCDRVNFEPSHHDKPLPS